MSSNRSLSMQQPQFTSDPSSGVTDPSGQQAVNMAAAIWRYRWAVLFPVIGGALIGLLVYLQLPETYRSTTRLMIESDRAAALDSMTGDLVGGVPSIDIVESQLYSDRVFAMAFNAPRVRPFHSEYENGAVDFIEEAQDALVLEPEVEDLRTASSLVTLMHYDSTNKEVCQATVQAFSDSLQDFYNQNYKSSRGDLINIISTAMEQLHPKMLDLENRYRTFRRDAPLAWDAQGQAINPHRERQLFLVKRRSELVEELRQKSIELASIDSIRKESSKDPLLGLNIIGQLLNRRFDLPSSAGLSDLSKADSILAENQIDQDLVPLIIERNKFESEFGANHPTVKALDAQLDTMKKELKRLVQEQTDRIVQLMDKSSTDPTERASEAVGAVVLAAKAQVDLVREQVQELDKQIADEKVAAAKMAQYEQENQAQLREIERTRELLDQLEEQMARVSLVEEDQGTRVIELTAPSEAYQVGPSLIKTIGLGTILGLMLGSGLALLLEKNANTFRDSDEIADILGVPVLTHIPFFKGRPRKAQKGEINPYKDLDPYLAVVHMPASVPSEAVRSCRTSIFFETASIPGGKVIQVTSPLPGDGKSTIAGNLACSIAQSGKKVLAIDCDLRRPQLTDNFDLADKSGLSSVLNGDCEPFDACHQTPLANLHVMPSGPIPANPAEALTMPEMRELLEMFRDEYDFIIIDTPPLLVVTDPSITASMVDGVVLGLRIRRKSRYNSKESINILRSVGARILGVVINNSDESGSSDGYRGHGYYRNGRYTNRYYRRSGSNGSAPSNNMVISSTGRPLSRRSKTSKPAATVSVGEENVASSAGSKNGSSQSDT